MASGAQTNDGKNLEAAVAVIEQAILRSHPGGATGEISVEPRKRILAKEVLHEIDLYVSVTMNPSYKAVFIFECKDWQENVGKNEIVEFSEKIKATNATQGFFVAKSYGRYALAQAKLDERMELVEAKFDLEAFDFNFSNSFGMKPILAKVDMKVSGVGDGGFERPVVPIDFEKDVVKLERNSYPVKLFCDQLNSQFIMLKYDYGEAERVLKALGVPVKYDPYEFGGSPLPPGIHRFKDTFCFDFSGRELHLNARRIAELCITLDHEVHIVPPVIHWSFVVGNRGRALRVTYFRPDAEPITLDVAQVNSREGVLMTIRKGAK